MTVSFVLLAYNKSGAAYVLINNGLESFVRYYSLPLPADYRKGGEEPGSKMEIDFYKGDFISPPQNNMYFSSWIDLLDFLQPISINAESIMDAKNFVAMMPPDWLEECINDIWRNEMKRLDRESITETRLMCSLLSANASKKSGSSIATIMEMIQKIHIELENKENYLRDRLPIQATVSSEIVTGTEFKSSSDSILEVWQ